MAEREKPQETLNQPEAHLYARQHKGFLLRAEKQGEAAMKQHSAILIVTILIIAMLSQKLKAPIF